MACTVSLSSREAYDKFRLGMTPSLFHMTITRSMASGRSSRMEGDVRGSPLMANVTAKSHISLIYNARMAAGLDTTKAGSLTITLFSANKAAG